MSGDFTDSDLALMLCTRVCHDMAGPISAINNGLEFYHDTDSDAAMQEQAMELLAMSAKAAQARLQLQRIAFGRSDSKSESNLLEFKDIVEQYFSQGKILLEWRDENYCTGWLNNEMRRLVASMILLVSQVMVYGGRMTIFLSNKDKDVIVRGGNGKLKNDSDLKDIVNGKLGDVDVELDPHNVVAWILQTIAEKMDIRMHMEIQEGGEGEESSVELKGAFAHR